jgi:hypothetical protein
MDPIRKKCGVIRNTGVSMKEKIAGHAADLSWEFVSVRP